MTITIDEGRLEERVLTTIGELGATLSSLLSLLGDRLGLYKAMAGAGPLTASELAGAHRHRRALRARMARQPTTV